MSIPLFIFRKASTKLIMTFINSVNEINIDWLTNILHSQVSSFRLRENMTFNSSVAHLDVDYATDKVLPQRLFLKSICSQFQHAANAGDIDD